MDEDKRKKTSEKNPCCFCRIIWRFIDKQKGLFFVINFINVNEKDNKDGLQSKGQLRRQPSCTLFFSNRAETSNINRVTCRRIIASFAQLLLVTIAERKEERKKDMYALIKIICTGKWFVGKIKPREKND
jgi:hypothetical protein